MCLWIDSRMFDVLPMEMTTNTAFRTIHIMVYVPEHDKSRRAFEKRYHSSKRFFRLMMGKNNEQIDMQHMILSKLSTTF